MKTLLQRIGNIYWYKTGEFSEEGEVNANNVQDVCDRVGAEDSGSVIVQYPPRDRMMLTRTLNSAKDAVASMIKRLAHRNANVQLYTLEARLHSRSPL